MTYSPRFSGNATVPSSESLKNLELNSTGSTITKLTPVRITNAGNIAPIDVSIEVEALAIAGLVDDDIGDGNDGNIVASGRIKNITTSAGFGAVLYVSKGGGVTDIKPEIGVGGFLAGDFVIKLGVVTKNANNPINKDLLVNINIEGQL